MHKACYFQNCSSGSLMRLCSTSTAHSGPYTILPGCSETTERFSHKPIMSLYILNIFRFLLQEHPVSQSLWDRCRSRIFVGMDKLQGYSSELDCAHTILCLKRKSVSTVIEVTLAATTSSEVPNTLSTNR